MALEAKDPFSPMQSHAPHIVCDPVIVMRHSYSTLHYIDAINAVDQFRLTMANDSN